MGVVSVVLVFLNKRHDRLQSTNVLLIATKNSLQTRSVVNPVEVSSVSRIPGLYIMSLWQLKNNFLTGESLNLIVLPEFKGWTFLILKITYLHGIFSN